MCWSLDQWRRSIQGGQGSPHRGTKSATTSTKTNIHLQWWLMNMVQLYCVVLAYVMLASTTTGQYLLAILTKLLEITVTIGSITSVELLKWFISLATHPPPTLSSFVTMTKNLTFCVLVLFGGSLIILSSIIYVVIIIVPFGMMIHKVTKSSPPDSYTPPPPPPKSIKPKRNRRPPRRRFTQVIKFTVAIIVLFLTSVDGVSSPPKPAVKRRGEPLPSPQPRVGNRDVNDLANSMGRSPMLEDNNNDDDNRGDIYINELKGEVDKIFGGWTNKNIITALKNLIDTHDSDLGEIRLATKNYLITLLECNDAKNLRKKFKKRQKSLSEEIGKLKLGDYVIASRKDEDNNSGDLEHWQSNFGEFLSSSTEGLVFANYSPVNDCALQDGKCCRQPRTGESLHD